MRIAKVEVFPLRLPMKGDFAISGGKVGEKDAGAPHVYVRITDENGEEGWGEARPSPRWSYETLETVVSTIRDYFAPLLEEREAEDLIGACQVMEGEIRSGQPIAKAAVDIALHDLIGRRTKQSLHELWYSAPRGEVSLSALISTSDPGAAAEQARRAREEGYRGVDVKIGLDPGQDLAVLEAVRSETTGLFFRVDANQRYTLAQAVSLSRELELLGVDVFEQPLPAHDLVGHAALRRKTTVPVALDESIWTPGDLIQAIRMEACDSVVIKLTKMGGLRGARLCGEVAREAGLSLLGGGLTESGLVFTASACLFEYLEIHDPVDLNGPFFLAEDPLAYGPRVEEGGRVLLPDGPGHGCRIDQEKLKRWRVGVSHDG
ncbi:mandelate racemase/muconate lactonizing enzyme family protein [Salinithrix halophila]|uniref:Mandelate racemase/muconate lactonizing enzyme family protein n=1 Tax=Salinithrix halophila TaxID=1485204 RepID=A0ABV8JG83_9BACL